MENYGITLFSETSAKTGDNVLDAFRKLGEKLLEKSRKVKALAKKEHEFVKLDVGDPYEGENKKKKSCCGK